MAFVWIRVLNRLLKTCGLPSLESSTYLITAAKENVPVTRKCMIDIYPVSLNTLKYLNVTNSYYNLIYSDKLQLCPLILQDCSKFCVLVHKLLLDLFEIKIVIMADVIIEPSLKTATCKQDTETTVKSDSLLCVSVGTQFESKNKEDDSIIVTKLSYSDNEEPVLGYQEDSKLLITNNDCSLSSRIAVLQLAKTHYKPSTIKHFKLLSVKCDSKSEVRTTEMAGNWTQRVPCRYFANGRCREGESCRYQHQVQTGTPLCSDSLLPNCHFFQWGLCAFGSRCRFAHVSDNLHSDERTVNQIMNVASSSTISTSENDIQQITQEAVVSDLQKTVVGIESDSAEGWVNAPEFCPSMNNNILLATKEVNPESYSDALKLTSDTTDVQQELHSKSPNIKKLCPYQEMGECKYGSQCEYIHGEMCDLCGHASLHPQDMEQQKKHTNECIKQHELDMEYSFAVARSKDKICGVCFEVVVDKPPPKQRFGILPNCNHCFCLSCIRKWRQVKHCENKIVRACPECRVTSDFVCPSMFWVDTAEEKEKLIKEYKGVLSKKNCKYFKSGQGKCPFGNKCFYLHAYPDGTKADVGPPRRRLNANGELDTLEELVLWDFLDERENRWSYGIDELFEVLSISDLEDSDSSDYDF